MRSNPARTGNSEPPISESRRSGGPNRTQARLSSKSRRSAASPRHSATWRSNAQRSKFQLGVDPASIAWNSLGAKTLFVQLSCQPRLCQFPVSHHSLRGNCQDYGSLIDALMPPKKRRSITRAFRASIRTNPSNASWIATSSASRRDDRSGIWSRSGASLCWSFA
jgi:hypothetical protein